MSGDVVELKLYLSYVIVLVRQGNIMIFKTLKLIRCIQLLLEINYNIENLTPPN